MSQIFHGRIKEMVRGSDLSTLSSKKIREQLEVEFKTDLSKRKKEIDDIVMGLLGVLEEDHSEVSQNAADDDDDDDNQEDNDNSTTDQPKKRRKKTEASTKTKKSKSDNSSRDEELARMLQDDGGRRTRSKSHHKEPRKKPAKRKSTGTSMFKKEMVLSSDLADIMGTNRMPTSKVVQRMWQIVKERDLRDPKNKQYHICDDQLLKVFGTRRVRTFSMMKYLKSHIKDPALLTNF